MQLILKKILLCENFLQRNFEGYLAMLVTSSIHFCLFILKTILRYVKGQIYNIISTSTYTIHSTLVVCLRHRN